MHTQDEVIVRHAVLSVAFAGVSALLPLPDAFSAPTTAPADSAAAAAAKPTVMPVHIAGHFLLSRAGTRKVAWQVPASVRKAFTNHQDMPCLATDRLLQLLASSICSSTFLQHCCSHTECVMLPGHRSRQPRSAV
jgi:phage tail sheath gpL-like